MIHSKLAAFPAWRQLGLHDLHIDAAQNIHNTNSLSDQQKLRPSEEPLRTREEGTGSEVEIKKRGRRQRRANINFHQSHAIPTWKEQKTEKNRNKSFCTDYPR